MLRVYDTNCKQKEHAGRHEGRKVKTMLYNEFLEGTGCRDNTHNYDVYKRVEQIYNNDNNMTHEEAYKIAAMWLDNSLSEEDKNHNEEVKAEIEQLKNEIAAHKANLVYYKDQTIYEKNAMKEAKYKIAALKTCIIK